MTTTNLIDLDKTFIRRAYAESGSLGQELRASMHFAMAEQRLATAGWFWSEGQFVAVSE